MTPTRMGQSHAFLKGVVAHAKQLETLHAQHTLKFHVKRSGDCDGVRIGMATPGRAPHWMLLPTTMHPEDYTPYEQLDEAVSRYLARPAGVVDPFEDPARLLQPGPS